MLEKVASLGFAALMLLFTITPVSAAGEQPTVRGRAALLLDGLTGQVLYQQNGMDKNFPASTTKLLTALVAMEHGELQQKITVSTNAIDQEFGSSMCYLNPGEEQTLEHLLYGLLLASGNDCAVAIAEGIGGSEAQFVTWMNETAQRIGATSSHFANPSGLHHPEHYTTAYDLALIAKEAMRNEKLLQIMQTKEFNWPGKSDVNGLYYNHNEMLWTYDGYVGGKTGFTEQAGLTLVSAANRGGHFLIGIVMGEQWKTEQYQDMAALLDYGFNNFEQKPIINAGTEMGEVPVTNGTAEDVALVAANAYVISVPKNGPSTVTTVTKTEPSLTAPVEASQKAGLVEIKDGDKVLGTVQLITKQTVAYNPLNKNQVTHWAVTVLKWVAYILGGLFVFRTTVKVVRRAMRRSRRPGAGSFKRRPQPGNSGMISAYRSRQQ